MPNLRPAKVAGFMILVLLVVSNLVLPAGAHITKRLPHLLRHLDPRYINVNETAANANLLDGQNSSAFLGANAKAADADLLDGQDSSAFLGANAKAADADLLDGQNSTSFMTGPGMVIEGAVTLPPFSDNNVFQGGGFNLNYTCPENLLNNGATGFANGTGGTVNLFIDNGSANPTYQQIAAGNSIVTPTAAAGEFITYQVHSPNQGIATIHVMTVHRASDCLFQVQAVISS